MAGLTGAGSQLETRFAVPAEERSREIQTWNKNKKKILESGATPRTMVTEVVVVFFSARKMH
uniref:Uncharacterized protein n=1 Tax=Oryza rufipogon TaxID=4529 RepID=A0A0E0RIW9_ORYRU